jgi:hypothetical protein
MPSFFERLQHGWNAFLSREPTDIYKSGVETYGFSYRPDRPRLTRGHERSIVTAVYNRIAIDVAQVSIRHVRLDENERIKETIHSGLNYCLTTEANVDQTGRSFIQDIVMSMLDEGCVAVVPVDTNVNPRRTDSFDIRTMRVGKITEWRPLEVKVRLYNERKGRQEEVILPKKMVAIIENPLYAVMNEPNSTLQRLIRKLNLLDSIDEQSGSGKLDLLIQLPYAIKTEARKKQADERRKAIIDQFATSKYGVAYIDSTEHVTQLNRSLENNLLNQVEYLTSMLYNQLGMSKEIFDGTADEAKMLNYNNRTIEPIVTEITDEFSRKFLTKTARTQSQAISFFREPFKLVPVNQLADIADKFTRNEILSSNEVRAIIGYKPSDQPGADELRNKNLNQQTDPNQMVPQMPEEEEGYYDEEYPEEYEEDYPEE